MCHTQKLLVMLTLTHTSDNFPHDLGLYLRYKSLQFSSPDPSHYITIIGWSLNKFITVYAPDSVLGFTNTAS